MFAEHLPSNNYPSAYPFSGFVININVSTRAHRDRKDASFCIVLEWSDCEGGEPVLFELGVVTKIGNGRPVALVSVKQTHFNLHYKGERMSAVLSADRYAASWLDSRGGLDENSDFYTVENV